MPDISLLISSSHVSLGVPLLLWGPCCHCRRCLHQQQGAPGFRVSQASTRGPGQEMPQEWGPRVPSGCFIRGPFFFPRGPLRVPAPQLLSTSKRQMLIRSCCLFLSLLFSVSLCLSHSVSVLCLSVVSLLHCILLSLVSLG